MIFVPNISSAKLLTTPFEFFLRSLSKNIYEEYNTQIVDYLKIKAQGFSAIRIYLTN